MKQLVIRALQKKAKKALTTFQPTVIAITGSMGKTSTKRAIALALSGSKTVRTAKKNYNNEIGVPLAILGEVSPNRSISGWLRLLLKPVKRMPEVIVLEYGADHPGDIQALCDLAPPHIGVETGISSVHVENYPDLNALVAEKATLVQNLPKDGLAVLNADDRHALGMVKDTRARVKTYGLKSEDMGVRNIEIRTRLDESFEPGEVFVKTSAQVTRIEEVLGELQLTNAIGYAPVMACLAALVIAEHLQVPLHEAIERLNKEYLPEAGRLNPIAGIKGSLVIDDSYNAAPAAMQNGLKILKMFQPGEEWDRRIAVLGSMAELGVQTDEEHRLIGMRAAEVADLFIAVGEPMQMAVRSAKEAGMNPEAVEWFATSEEAGRYLDRVLRQGDVVYVKGAQSARMEKVVKDIMAEPLRAKELLVRQEAYWTRG